MATRRGGQQRIPRPQSYRPGGPPPWAALAPGQRRFTLDEIRERLADQAGAIADFRKALEIDPSFQQPAEGLQRLKAGPASR